MLSLRTPTASRAPAASARSRAPPRRAVVPVRAAGGGLGEVLQSIGESFVRIMSPPKDQAPNGDWSGTTSPFSGRVDRDRRGRPFADNFATKPATKPAAAAGAASGAAADEDSDGEEGYLDGAVQGLMGKNFPGKDDGDRPTTGSQGWKGDLHGRKTDGFHSRKI